MSSVYVILLVFINLRVLSSPPVKYPAPKASLARSSELQAARSTCDRNPLWRNLRGMAIPRLLPANISSSSPGGTGRVIETPRVCSSKLSPRVPDPEKQQSKTTVFLKKDE